MKRPTLLCALLLVLGCQPGGAAPPDQTGDYDSPTGQGEVSLGYQFQILPCPSWPDDWAWLKKVPTNSQAGFQFFVKNVHAANPADDAVSELTSLWFYDVGWPSTAVCWDKMPSDWYGPSGYYNYNWHLEDMWGSTNDADPWLRVRAHLMHLNPRWNEAPHQWVIRDGYTWVKEW